MDITRRHALDDQHRHAYSENKKRRPEPAQGFKTTPYPDVKLKRKVIFLVETDRTIKRFSDFEQAKAYCRRYVPDGYAVARWYEPSEDAWLNWRVWYSPHYKGRQLKTANPRDPYREELPKKKPPALVVRTKPIRADDSLAWATCYTQAKRDQKLPRPDAHVLDVIARTSGNI